MGAWIEILKVERIDFAVSGRTPRWVRGLKSIYCVNNCWCTKSHPTMGAWIEICNLWFCLPFTFVAPHDGCVDWNCTRKNQYFRNIVAPHDGCVDWNFAPNNQAPIYSLSHPTMGAWIEIAILVAILSNCSCRTPRWVRGLKYYRQNNYQ